MYALPGLTTTTPTKDEAERYSQGYQHMKEFLTDYMNFAPGRKLSADDTYREAIGLARRANMHIHHGRHPETSVYREANFREGSLDAVRDMVTQANRYRESVGPRMRI